MRDEIKIKKDFKKYLKKFIDDGLKEDILSDLEILKRGRKLERFSLKNGCPVN